MSQLSDLDLWLELRGYSLAHVVSVLASLSPRPLYCSAKIVTFYCLDSARTGFVKRCH